MREHRLKRSAENAFEERFAFRPLDEQFANQPYYFTISAVAMWAGGLTGISATNPITVAVIDTGADLDHPDIDGNLAPGYDLVSMGTAPPQDGSPDSHGSMVAGVIGAEINNDIVGGIHCGPKSSPPSCVSWTVIVWPAMRATE